jgi:hypothetical protein
MSPLARKGNPVYKLFKAYPVPRPENEYLGYIVPNNIFVVQVCSDGLR